MKEGDDVSDIPSELILRDTYARIDRQLAETRKFSEESIKLVAAAHKFNAEASKLGRDRWLAPVIAVASTIGAVAASIAAYGSLIRASGHG